MISDFFFFFWSVKPEEKAKEKVIPCQTKNHWILPSDTLERQAAEELMKGEIHNVLCFVMLLK